MLQWREETTQATKREEAKERKEAKEVGPT